MLCKSLEWLKWLVLVEKRVFFLTFRISLLMLILYYFQLYLCDWSHCIVNIHFLILFPIKYPVPFLLFICVFLFYQFLSYLAIWMATLGRALPVAVNGLIFYVDFSNIHFVYIFRNKVFHFFNGFFVIQHSSN